MIFDSDAMQALRAKYKDVPDLDLPAILQLDRSGNAAGERAYLEDLLLRAPEGKRPDWCHRLLSDEHDQHVGSWFEIMLFGWLGSVGAVEVEPSIEGESPDFAVMIGSQRVVVEATAWPWVDEQRKRASLRTLQAPRAKSTRTGGLASVHWLNPGLVRQQLRDKAKQHRRLRTAGYPYLLALYIENPLYSVEQVLEAWFGVVEYVVNVDELRIVDQHLDGKGLHYFGHEVRHRSVSGTLVFKPGWNADEHRRLIEARYVQNPYAKVPIDASTLPVLARYEVTESNGATFRMGWRS